MCKSLWDVLCNIREYQNVEDVSHTRWLFDKWSFIKYSCSWWIIDLFFILLNFSLLKERKTSLSEARWEECKTKYCFSKTKMKDNYSFVNAFQIWGTYLIYLVKPGLFCKHLYHSLIYSVDHICENILGHLHTQTIRAGTCSFDTIFTGHMSYVICHMSCVRSQVSHVKCHMSHAKK